MPGLPSERAGLDAGLRVVREVYADRAYGEDGNLTPRGMTGAVIADPAEAAARVVRMLEEGVVRTLSGRAIPVAIETVCVHGDTPGAVDLARRVRSALEAAGVSLAPFVPAGER